MAIEKRKERRIKVSLPIKIVYKNNRKVLGRTANISRLGTYAEIDREIPAGTDIDITLEIPKYSQDLSLTGKIRSKANIFRCSLVRKVGLEKYYGIGIFFIEFLKEADRNKLSKYIDFLILNEDKDIREGVKRWRKKRDITKMVKEARQIETKQEKFQTEAINLLKEILNRLEEIQRLFKSKYPPARF